MELNDNVSELKDSIGQVLVTITPEMCLQIMLSLPRRLQLCVQSVGQYFQNLCKIANSRFKQEGCRPTFFARAPLLRVGFSRCLNCNFATLYRFSNYWSPDLTYSCKRHCTLSMPSESVESVGLR